MDEEEIKIKMDDGVTRFFTRFGGIFYFYLLTCGRCSLVSEKEARVGWVKRQTQIGVVV